MDRKCSSGLNAIALAARAIMCDEIDVAVAGGMESISLTINKHAPTYRNRSEFGESRTIPHAYMAMIETAEIVADRYGISREDAGRFAAHSQQRAAAAQTAGLSRRNRPHTVHKALFDKEGNETGKETVTLVATKVCAATPRAKSSLR